jgi:hypothetical protein
MFCELPCRSVGQLLAHFSTLAYSLIQEGAEYVLAAVPNGGQSVVTPGCEAPGDWFLSTII